MCILNAPEGTGLILPIAQFIGMYNKADYRTDSADRILKGDMLIALGVRSSSNRSICAANEGLKLEFVFGADALACLVAAFISEHGCNNNSKFTQR